MLVPVTFNVRKVAPFVGAWIETCVLLYYAVGGIVAPFVGAWIETKLQ